MTSILTERWMRCTVWFPQVEDCSCGTCCGEGKPFRGTVEKSCSRLRVVLLGRYHYTMTVAMYFELILRHSLVSKSKVQCYKIGIGGHYVPKSPWEETILKKTIFTQLIGSPPLLESQWPKSQSANCRNVNQGSCLPVIPENTKGTFGQPDSS